MLTRFVRAEGNRAPAGVGKLVSASGSTATVEYFHSPTDDPVLVTLPVASLRQIEVPAQTRIYWLDPEVGVWRVGRVMDGEGERFAVRFPNGDERILPTQDLYVRWDRPITDPTSYLAHWVIETPRFADARNGFVNALVEQRAACQGMSALLSSVIELEPHQIEVVRRVLQDPVQRYLLADEVGLGKTIEAGVLIRQYVLDDPKHKVVILVPEPLAAQWKDELRGRFLLDVGESDESVCMLSTADPAVVAPALDGAGMLVIDEAHHLSRDAALYELLREAASVVPRVLLLSATPVLHNERAFLEMLHLLDPVIYPLHEEEAFRRKITNRQALAETVAGLVPENLLQLEDFLDDLAVRFDDDAPLMEHVATLRSVVQTLPAEDDPDFLKALLQIRAHLSEVYRLDRRILRNRRASVAGLTPERAGVTIVDYRSPAASQWAEAMEAWRSDAALRIYGKENSDSARRTAEWFADLVNFALSDHPALVAWLQAEKSVEGPDVGNLRAAAEVLADDESRMAALLEALTRVGDGAKCAIFCTSVSTADRLADFLRAHLNELVERPDRCGDDNTDGALLRFMEDPACRVLVCDQRDEEGLNLQGGAKAIIHYDLPLAPNRIEQRIGRLDRYGSGDAIRSFVLRCLDDSFEQAWTAFLTNGLGVFDRSIASLQYLVDTEMQSLSVALLTESEEAIGAITARLGGPDGEVVREWRRIDHQDALDALATPPEDSFEELFEVDDDWGTFQERVDQWLVNCLLMTRLDGPDVGQLVLGDRVVRFGLNRRGGQQTLIPLDRFIETMLPALDLGAPGASSRNPVSFPYSCRRGTALSRRCRRAGVRLLRYGDVLFDGVEAFTSIDDRGRCFAMWREVPDYGPTDVTDAFIRSDFVVEADITQAIETYVAAVPEAAHTAEAALRRRGDMMFPPFFHRLWLDEELRAVVDPALLAWLDAPYTPETTEEGWQDTNLNPQRIHALQNLKLPVIEGWRGFVEQARRAAEDLLYHRQQLTTRGEQAVTRARTVDAGRFAQLRMRIQQGDYASLNADRRLIDVEEQVAAALYQGMLTPRISLDTIGVIFLSNQPLNRTLRRGRLTEGV